MSIKVLNKDFALIVSAILNFKQFATVDGLDLTLQYFTLYNLYLDSS